jgi:hypothetical protein
MIAEKMELSDGRGPDWSRVDKERRDKIGGTDQDAGGFFQKGFCRDRVIDPPDLGGATRLTDGAGALQTRLQRGVMAVGGVNYGGRRDKKHRRQGQEP